MGIALILGFIFVIFSSMAFGIAGFYFTQSVKIGDVCEQVFELENYHKKNIK